MKTIVVKRIFSIIPVILFFIVLLDPAEVFAAPAPEKPVVVVIDPGHGGKSNGAEYFDLKEKDLDLAVAQSIKKNLEYFEGVKVYLTRTDDRDVSYKNRSNYAKTKKADYFISVHFNESAEHNQTGCEIFVQSNTDLNKKIMPVAQSLMNNMGEYGIHEGGIYTCTNEDGKDYFGILENTVTDRIPALILEHFYMDREEALPLINTKEAVDEIGRQDALAIARALKLDVATLFYGYRDLPDVEYTDPVALKEGYTHPAKALLIVKDYEQITNRSAVCTIRLIASDPKTALAFYRLSEDGGKTYGEDTEFDHASTTEFTVTVRTGESHVYSALAYNENHLCVRSNDLNIFDEIVLDPEFTKHQLEAKQAKEAAEAALKEAETASEAVEESTGDVNDANPKLTSAQGAVVIFGGLFGLAMAFMLLIFHKKERG